MNSRNHIFKLILCLLLLANGMGFSQNKKQQDEAKDLKTKVDALSQSNGDKEKDIENKLK